MPTISIDHESIYYAVRGNVEPAVVFIHGAGANHLIWGAQLAAVAPIAHAYALDLPGHSRSSGAGRDTIGDYARAMAAFLDALEMDRALIVGHSMGGAIAQTLALDVSDRVSGLALVGTGARLRVSPAFLNGLSDDFSTTAKLLIESEFAPASDADLKRKSERQLLGERPEVVYGDYVACNEFDVMTRLNEIRTPTLVVCGVEDKMTPIKYSEYLAAQIQGARLELIEAAGHYVMLEQPDALNRALVEFANQPVWMG